MRLSDLVEEFLQFARPQPLQLAETDVGALVGRVWQRLAAELRGAEVELEISGGPLSIELDAERMEQVVLHLLRNAIEAIGASGRPGRIRVALSEATSGATVEIADDGPGIVDEAPVFEPFYTTKTDGTGLGLAIVHRIVEDHGGHVSFHSRPGETVFSMLLPRARAPVLTYPR